MKQTGKPMMRVLTVCAVFGFSALFMAASSGQEPASAHAAEPKPPFVVFLGTGTPGPTPKHQGPSLAVIAGDRASAQA
jgi:hypothetical protein